MLFDARTSISRASKCPPDCGGGQHVFPRQILRKLSSFFHFRGINYRVPVTVLSPRDCIRMRTYVARMYFVRTSAAPRCAYAPRGGRAGIADWQFSLYLAFDKFPPVHVIQILSVHRTRPSTKLQGKGSSQRQSWRDLELSIIYILLICRIFLMISIDLSVIRIN